MSASVKDFQQDILNQYYIQAQKQDPFVYATPEVAEFIRRANVTLVGKFIITNTLCSILFAPLQTIVSSLQMSVQKHKNIHQTQQAKTKELAKLNTTMTVHQKRKFQLMVRAGGKTIPYVAPVYEGYRQTFQGLKSQGWIAFWKGAGWRAFSTFIYFIPFANSMLMISNQQLQNGPIVQISKLYASCLALDFVMSPIHTFQNRYVLQNRIPQFRSVRNPSRTAKKLVQAGEVWKGASYHFISNTIGLFTRFPLYGAIIGANQNGVSSGMYGAFIAGETILYPFLTAFRRLQCQTEKYVGMIPVRYSGLFHAVRVIAFQQGIKGLYRAFPLHILHWGSRLKLLEYLNKAPTVRH